MSKAMELCAYAQAQVDNGSIYVLGAQGETGAQINEAWIKKREHYDAGNYNRAIKLWKKRLSQGYVNLRAFDCSGLIVRWLMDNGLLKKDKTANGLFFDECRQIAKSELRAGDLVFKKYATNSRMYHVGVYMGDGYVIHSKGRDDGVVREKLSATGWNRFGRLKALSDAGDNVVIARLLKKGTKGDDVEAIQQALIKLGYDLGKWGADGDFGSQTRKAVRAFQKDHGLQADGVVGPNTAEALGLDWKKG